MEGCLMSCHILLTLSDSLCYLLTCHIPRQYLMTVLSPAMSHYPIIFDTRCDLMPRHITQQYLTKVFSASMSSYLTIPGSRCHLLPCHITQQYQAAGVIACHATTWPYQATGVISYPVTLRSYLTISGGRWGDPADEHSTAEATAAWVGHTVPCPSARCTGNKYSLTDSMGPAKSEWSKHYCKSMDSFGA